MKKKNFEIRKNDDGTLDEVVADHPLFVHLEQMDDNAWWLGIDIDGKLIHINFAARGKIKAIVEVENE